MNGSKRSTSPHHIAHRSGKGLRVAWSSAAMILVSLFPATNGYCRQQVPPRETPDAYYDSKQSTQERNGPKAATQSLELKPLEPAPNSPAPDDPAATSPLRPQSESAANAASASSSDQIGGDRTVDPPGAATRIIDQLAAQVTTGTEPQAQGTRPETQVSAESTRDAFEPGRVLAIVGGRPILVGDMLYEINERIEQIIPTAPPEIKEQQREKLYSAWLTKFIDQQLLYTDVVRELPAEADLEKMFESIGESFDKEALPDFLKKQSFNKPLDFDIYLRSLGSSLRKFRERWIEDQFVRYFVGQKFASNYEPSHSEMWAYYQQHLADYSFQSRARWEQLVIRFDRVPDKSEARTQIAKLGNEVVYGASFEAIAKQSSHDSKAADGGQQGWVNQGSLADAALDSTIFSIPTGELSDIVESAVGFHIVRVHERVPAGTKSFPDAQPEIREKLVGQHKTKKVEEYLTRLRREIPIEIVDPVIELPPGYNIRTP